MEFRLRGPVTVEPEKGEAVDFAGKVTIVPEGEEMSGSFDELASGSSSNIGGNCSSSSGGSEVQNLGELGDLTVAELVERARAQERG